MVAMTGTLTSGSTSGSQRATCISAGPGYPASCSLGGKSTSMKNSDGPVQLYVPFTGNWLRSPLKSRSILWRSCKGTSHQLSSSSLDCCTAPEPQTEARMKNRITTPAVAPMTRLNLINSRRPSASAMHRPIGRCVKSMTIGRWPHVGPIAPRIDGETSDCSDIHSSSASFVDWSECSGSGFGLGRQ